MVSNADCAKTYKALFHPLLHLCTKDSSSRHAQACPGDSGSAVLVRRDGVLQLAGLVTWGGETQGKECGEGPIDVSERVLAHQAFLNAPAPAQFAPYSHAVVSVVKRGTLRHCRRGTWHPAAAHFSYRWFRRHGERKALPGRRRSDAPFQAPDRLPRDRPHRGRLEPSESYNVR